MYQKHRDGVVAYCRRRAAPSDALDAAAETFAVAWRRWDARPEADMMMRWLYGIAHRVIANQRRGFGRYRNLVTKVRATLPDPGPADPPEVVVRAERESELLAAFARLRQSDQEILRLITWEELPRDQAAYLLGISRSALDQRLHRATNRLRKELGVPRAKATPSAVEGRTP